MMTQRHLIGLVIFGAAAILGLAGCNGPAPALDPVITMDFDKGGNWPYMQAGSSFFIEGKAAVADEAKNPVIEARWEQEPANAGHFLVDSPNSMTNVWRAPFDVTQQTPVTLKLTTKTLQGGTSETSLNLIIVPRGCFPSFSFDPAMPTTVAQGTTLAISGTYSVENTLNGTNAIDAHHWTQEPQRGTFSNPDAGLPTWTAPMLEVDQNNQPIPETVVLTVVAETTLGFRGGASVPVRVVP